MKTLPQLYDELSDQFDLLKKDPRRLNQVDGLVNAAGKMVSIVKVQMDYSILLNQEPEIPAMGKMSGRPLIVSKGVKLIK